LVGKPETKRPLGRPRNRYDMIYWLTAIGLILGGSSTVHIYAKQYIEQHNRHKQYIEQYNSRIRKSANRTSSLRVIPWHLPYKKEKTRENLSQVGWYDNIKMDLQKVGWGAWTRLIWLRIGTIGGHL
jgi:hypothetical protein